MTHMAEKIADGVVSAIVETRLLSDSVLSPVKTISGVVVVYRGRLEIQKSPSLATDMVCLQLFPLQIPKYSRMAIKHIHGFVSVIVGLRLLCMNRIYLKVTQKAAGVWLALTKNINQAI